MWHEVEWSEYNLFIKLFIPASQTLVVEMLQDFTLLVVNIVISFHCYSMIQKKIKQLTLGRSFFVLYFMITCLLLIWHKTNFHQNVNSFSCNKRFLNSSIWFTWFTWLLLGTLIFWLLAFIFTFCASMV